MSVHVTEVARVTPAADSDSVDSSANSLTIPLTFFDLPWLVFHPFKRLLFYKLPDSSREHFHIFILPNLKLSLSLVLRHYLPLSGRVTWDPSDPKPSILVSPNDAVSLTIAETESDFSHLSSYEQRAVSELHTLLPKLPMSDESLSAMSLQITLFPNQGFSIGIVAHHGVLDGKSSSMFTKAWAHISKHLLQSGNENRISLPETLTPTYDRSSLIFKDRTELDSEMIEGVRSMKKDRTNLRSLAPLPDGEHGDDVVLATLLFSREDIERLRERVKTETQSPLHLSAFVIAYAYVWTCFVKARGGSGERSVSILFVADFRERLDPPLPATYFGNCMFPAGRYNRKAEEFAGEKGFVTTVELLSDLVKGLSSRKIETIAKEFSDSFDCFGVTTQYGAVAGSSRLGLYDADFGWGRPVKTDVVSIGGEGISMGEKGDNSGGLEIGVCMKKAEMGIVVSLFNSGLQN